MRPQILAKDNSVEVKDVRQLNEFESQSSTIVPVFIYKFKHMALEGLYLHISVY